MISSFGPADADLRMRVFLRGRFNTPRTAEFRLQSCWAFAIGESHSAGSSNRRRRLLRRWLLALACGAAFPAAGVAWGQDAPSPDQSSSTTTPTPQSPPGSPVAPASSLSLAAPIASQDLFLPSQNIPSRDLPIPAVGTVSFNVNLSTEYETNAASSSAEVAHLRGLKLEDVLFTPSASFILSHALGRATLYLQGDAGYQFHANNTILNSQNIDITGGVDGRVGRCRDSLRGTFAERQSDLSTVGLPVVKNTVTEESVDNLVTCGRTTGLTYGLRTTYSDTTNSYSHGANSNNFLLSPNLSYATNSLGTLGVYANFEIIDYPNYTLPGLPVIGQNRYIDYSYNLYTGGIRYSTSTERRLQATASLGYTEVADDHRLTSSSVGFVYDVTAQYRLTPRSNVFFNLSRSTNPTAQANSTLSVHQLVGGGLNYNLNLRTNISLNLSYETTDYQGAPILDPNSNSHPSVFLQKQQLFTAMTTINHDLNRRLSLQLRGGVINSDANYSGYRYLNGLVEAVVRVKF